MSREFDGIDDRIRVTAGAVASLDGGPITYAMLWRPLAVEAGGLIWASNAGAAEVLSVNPFSDGNYYLASGGGFQAFTGYAVADNWTLIVFTKADGIATPRVHRYFYDAPGWSHANLGGTLGDSVNGPISAVQFGQYALGADYGAMRLAAIGIWGSALSDVDVETLETHLGAWNDLSPAALWAFNQAAVTDPVNDVTAGGANQFERVGTAVSGDEPSGWSYSLGGITVNGVLTADLGALTGTLDGDRTTFGTMAGTLGPLSATMSGEEPDHLLTVNLNVPGFASIVTGIGACVVDALQQTPALAPSRQCLLLPTNQIPWDNCDCDGQVALAIRSVYNSDVFPQPSTGKAWGRCSPHFWVARVVVSVTRCVPTMDEFGVPPSCSAELAAAITLENDRTAVRQALACCLQDLFNQRPPRIAAWLLDQSVTVGELGGCAGVETEFLVGVNACPCPGG